jgi:uncharacterized protein involved in response to NO
MSPALVPAHRVFFPAAAAHAGLAVPWFVAALAGWAWAPPGLSLGTGHAHEMLFGFGLAAVAGNQLGPLPRTRLALLFATWLAARAAFIAAPGGLAASLANGAFAGFLAWHMLPRLASRVRRWRNRAVPVGIVALCVTALVAQGTMAMASPRTPQAALLAGVLLLSLLMLFMGGRIIAPASPVRVQPRLEGALIVLMAIALPATVLGAAQLAGVALLACAALATWRLARWRPWSFTGRRDLACLAVGYAWLAAGLGAIGGALLAGARPTLALHVVTIGAMGTLTVNVMALTWARLARRDPGRLVLPSLATAFVALANAARLAADADPARRMAWLLAAAAAWSGAWLLLLACFAGISSGRRA